MTAPGIITKRTLGTGDCWPVAERATQDDNRDRTFASPMAASWQQEGPGAELRVRHERAPQGHAGEGSQRAGIETLIQGCTVALRTIWPTDLREYGRSHDKKNHRVAMLFRSVGRGGE